MTNVDAIFAELEAAQRHTKELANSEFREKYGLIKDEIGLIAPQSQAKIDKQVFTKNNSG